MSEKVLMTPAELAEQIKSPGIVLIDTRNPKSYEAGHLPGAVNIHDIFTYLATSTPEGVVAMRDRFAGMFGAAGLSGAKTAVVYEQSMDTGFGQSCRGYVLLRYLGYPKVTILHGGYAAWTAAGLPTTTEVPAPETKSFPIDPTAASILVDLAAMLRQARYARRRRVDCRQFFPLRQRLLPAQRPHPRGGVDRMVPDDEADAGGPDVQIAGGDPRRMRHRRHHARYPGRPLLLQGCACVEHAGRAQGGRHQGCQPLFRLLERMVARSVAADRGGTSVRKHAVKSRSVREQAVALRPPQATAPSRPSGEETSPAAVAMERA